MEVRAPGGDADGGAHGEDGDLDQNVKPDRDRADRRCGPLEGDPRQEQRAAKEEPEEEEPQGARPASREDPAGPPVGAPGADRGVVPARGAREVLQQREDRIENQGYDGGRQLEDCRGRAPRSRALEELPRKGARDTKPDAEVRSRQQEEDQKALHVVPGVSPDTRREFGKRDGNPPAQNRHDPAREEYLLEKPDERRPPLGGARAGDGGRLLAEKIEEVRRGERRMVLQDVVPGERAAEGLLKGGAERCRRENGEHHREARQQENETPPASESNHSHNSACSQYSRIQDMRGARGRRHRWFRGR